MIQFRHSPFWRWCTKWYSLWTYCCMSLPSSCHCLVLPLPLSHPPPKCSRWCLSPVQSGWWMYHWFLSSPRPLLVGCSPLLVEWSTWQCRSHFPQQEPAMLLSESKKCYSHQEWHGHPPPCWVVQSMNLDIKWHHEKDIKTATAKFALRRNIFKWKDCMRRYFLKVSCTKLCLQSNETCVRTLIWHNFILYIFGCWEISFPYSLHNIRIQQIDKCR